MAVNTRFARRTLGIFAVIGVLLIAGCGSNYAAPASDTAPVVTTNPANLTVTVGTNASFTAAASGSPVPTVQWQVSTDSGVTFTSVAGATSTTLALTAVTAGQTGNRYRATFTNSAGTATTTAATLTVVAAPAITSFVVGQTSVTAGGTTTLTAVFSGGTGSVNNGVGAVVSGTAVNITPAATTTYTLTVTNAAGTPITATATVTVNAASSSVSGTAASGSPIVGATVTLKDSAGRSTNTTTASDGTYTLNTTGMTPPFLVQVQTAKGNLYSVSADALITTTINAHPFTDLIIRSWYSAQAVSIDTAFGNPVSMPAPAPASMQIVNNAVTNLAQLWLTNAGVNTAQFNLISSPFTANGAGLDQVLDESTVNASTGSVTIAAGGTTQTSTITYNTSAGTMTVASTTTNANGTSVSSNTTVVPTQTAQQTALNSIIGTMTGLANAINSNGSQLTAAEITPFLATDLLDGGLNQSQYAAMVVTHLRGATLSSAQIQTVKSLDLVKGIADIIFNGFGSQPSSGEFWFENVGGTWLIGGDKRIFQIQAQVAARTSEGVQTQGALGNGVFVSAYGWAQEGAVTSVTVTDPSGITGWNSTSLPLGSIVVETFQPTPTTQLVLNLQSFDKGWLGLGSTIIPAGTLFNYAVTPASGPVVNYTWPSNVFTNELISITSANSTSPPSGSLSNYPVGVPLPVTWTLPTTFAIATVYVSGEAFSVPIVNNGYKYDCFFIGQTNPTTGPTFPTSGTITFPSTCNGFPVVFEELEVGVLGVNGETETATVNIQ
jgi:Immunoglobulin I-set domain